jgi:hypothetical protein
MAEPSTGWSRSATRSIAAISRHAASLASSRSQPVPLNKAIRVVRRMVRRQDVERTQQMNNMGAQ